MKPDILVEELKQLAEQLGVTVRQEIGNFNGGYCILHEKKLIVVNKKLTPNIKAAVLAQSLGHFALDEVYIKPVLREYIEDQVHRMKRANGAVNTVEAE
jgi:Zn-dependent peptidase ImmA (M78 family)